MVIRIIINNYEKQKIVNIKLLQIIIIVINNK
jgi:hypothetical protein